jgi:small-conductance mechanosensitive channel
MDMVHPITTRFAVLTLTLGALALSGWGAFAYAGRSAAAVESELTAQVSRLEVEREQLHAERTRLQETVKEVHGRLAAAREEQSRGVRARDQARADLATAQQQLAILTKRLDQANGRVAQTGAVMPPPAPIQIAQRLKQRVAQAWSGLVPVPPARIPERVNERAR